MDYLKYLVHEIHSVIAATVDLEGLPVTCAMDLMDYDGDGVYFLTARGKSLYDRLTAGKYIALTGMKGESTMSRAAVSLRGQVEELGADALAGLLKKNPYMLEIYPTEESRKALTVFRIYNASGEWFDLRKKPVERAAFTVGMAQLRKSGYYITETCIGCGRCLSVCPQSCIREGTTYEVVQENCLHCGNCMVQCPVNAIDKRG